MEKNKKKSEISTCAIAGLSGAERISSGRRHTNEAAILGFLLLLLFRDCTDLQQQQAAAWGKRFFDFPFFFLAPPV